MLVKECIVGKRYRIKNVNGNYCNIYKIIQNNKEKETVLGVCKNDKTVYTFGYFQVVSPVDRGKDRLTETDINSFINYLKHKDYFITNKKEYCIFLRNSIKYRFLFKAQKVTTIKPIIGLTCNAKYGRYYAYKINEFMKWFKEE
jgi:hypothetical protein